MTYARTHRSLIAWMLYAFILFNGLVCSIGHGQMIGDFANAASLTGIECGGQLDSALKAKLPDMSEQGVLMKLSTGDCAFAATLALAVVFFLGLSWLIGSQRQPCAQADHARRKPPRHSFPGLAPQAP